MAKLTADECRDMASQYFDMAKTLSDYRFAHWDELADADRSRIQTFQAQLMHYSTDLTADAITQTLSNLQDADSAKLKQAVSKMKDAINKANIFSKVIQYAAAAALLGAAIATGDIPMIATAAKDAYATATA